MTIALIGITLVYLYIIGRFVLGFDRVKPFHYEDSKPKTTFSIIIPFRNEVEHLPTLLQSLSELNYPKDLFEIILVDDESTDASVKIIEKFLANAEKDITVIKNIRKTNAPKKDAIVTAINQSKHNWVVTTDADCVFTTQWLIILDAYIREKHPKMVVGPVTFAIGNSFLQRFQLIDFFSLMGATIGGFGIKKPFLCNGANLAYKKTLFNALNGFDGNTNIASGDDIFLMEKVLKQSPEELHYLKHEHAVVTTKPQHTLRGLISQRKRWAAKTSSYSNSFGKLVGSVVLLMNFSLLAALFLSIFGVFTLKTIGYVFLIKFCIDLLLIFKMAQFFNQTTPLKSYFLCSILYPFFNVYVALSSWFGGYTWKGRTFSK